MAEEIRHACQTDHHPNALTSYVANGWPSIRTEANKGKIAVIDGLVMNGTKIIDPASLQQWAHDQLHINQMEIEKIGLLDCGSAYWVDINNDI